MPLLTRDYFRQNKRWVLAGAVLAITFAAMIFRGFGGSGAFGTFIGLAILGFPFTAKTQAERLLRSVLIGFYLSLAFVYGGRLFLPLAGIGFLGCLLFGAMLLPLRYKPPN